MMWEKPPQVSQDQHNTEFCVHASCLRRNHTDLLLHVFSVEHIVILHLCVWKVAAVFLEVKGHPISVHKQLDYC